MCVTMCAVPHCTSQPRTTEHEWLAHTHKKIFSFPFNFNEYCQVVNNIERICVKNKNIFYQRTRALSQTRVSRKRIYYF